MHHHCSRNTNLTLVYFYSKEYGNTFKFYNEEYSKYYSQGLIHALNIPDQEVITPDIKTGDLLIFPANYLHMAIPFKEKSNDSEISQIYKELDTENTENTENTERITISLNLNIKIEIKCSNYKIRILRGITLFHIFEIQRVIIEI